jgi:hypothetical protein
MGSHFPVVQQVSTQPRRKDGVKFGFGLLLPAHQWAMLRQLTLQLLLGSRREQEIAVVVRHRRLPPP